MRTRIFFSARIFFVREKFFKLFLVAEEAQIQGFVIWILVLKFLPSMFSNR